MTSPWKVYDRTLAYLNKPGHRVYLEVLAQSPEAANTTAIVVGRFATPLKIEVSED